MPSPARACRQAITDANHRWPSRDRANDGIMGDARHQRRKSDHNLGNAVDITHDPASGCEGPRIAAIAMTDPRVTYVIWNRHIWSRARAAEGWRPYHGQNPHDHHCHISVSASLRDDDRHWGWAPGSEGAIPADDRGAAPEPTKGATSDEDRTVSHPARKPSGGHAFPGTPLQQGSRGVLVQRVQERLLVLRWEIVVDGVFGTETHNVVCGLQRRHDLPVDGVVGRRTWRALFP